MIDRVQLLASTKRLVRSLVEDLRTAAGNDTEVADVVDTEYSRASAAGRTGLAKAEWAEGFYAQVAVAWTLGAVFVRFCEDNDLVPEPLLAGVGRRRGIALDHRSAYLQANPAHDDRHWLREIFSQYQALPATGAVFGDHNPIWLLAPSADGARDIIQAFQDIDPETGETLYDFTDADWDTRFLGDLYQDLSEHAKKTYALLQTPSFVEEFILDRTLEPALATFGLRETTVIDPTCGSGHFLLGTFSRLFARWCDEEPGTNRRDLARRALDAIGGVDLNPFAVSIARFRLVLAALRAGGDKRLADAPAYPVHLAVGDSLLHGDPPGRLEGTIFQDEVVGAAAHGYDTEDLEAARSLLTRSWHVVVGNPPYITVKDPALNELYRRRFTTCKGKYSLGVPFTERFFQLACYDNDLERSGYVGMITANSFMKREMGKALIENWMPAHDITHVIDTSGAYIPGHGTPTVILFGRNRKPVSSNVRAVMGIRGEPSTPPESEKALVWSSIVELVDQPGSSSDYVSVVDLARSRLAKHPWSIGGGGAAELKELLDERCNRRLADVVDSIGVFGMTNMDDAVLAERASHVRHGAEPRRMTMLVTGEHIRDWSVGRAPWSYFPYESELLVDVLLDDGWLRRLWPTRTNLWARATFSKNTYRSEGRTWWEWHQVTLYRLRTPLSISFAFVATHNHFVLDRGGKVFNRSAPVIKLPEGADERRHLELLGVLNSSTACFWMQQVFHNKGGPGGGSSKDEKWHDFYEHDGTKLQALPLSENLDPSHAILLDSLAGELIASTPATIVRSDVPSVERLVKAKAKYDRVRSRMIAAQEELDWEMYRRYGLIDEDLTCGNEDEPLLDLGERAFEIVLARRIRDGEADSKWFARLGARAITRLPDHWSDSYKGLVRRRIGVIESDLNIGLIERQETKRRWEQTSWEEQVQTALREWLLDRLESARYWPDPPAMTTTARLASEARADPDFVQVARIYVGREDLDIADVVADLVAAEAVPYLAAMRYTEAGLRKYSQWLSTWDLQRREDAGEDVGTVPIPPKYTSTDFVGVSWSHRGKLDVPKERFISYPGAQRPTDSSLPVGWAGWDHLARARALATWYVQAKREARDVEHLTPMLAGLAELVPWLKQWYDEPNADPALDRPGSQIATVVDAELRALGLSAEDLVSWRPAASLRGRRRRS